MQLIGHDAGRLEPDVLPSDCEHGDGGFTLVEIVAALSILTLTLTVFFATISEGSHRQRRARTAAEASLLAQSLLARVGPEWPLRPGRSTGESAGGYKWQIAIAPYNEAGVSQQISVSAYRVDVFVYGAGAASEPAANLSTIRLGPKDTR